ncbi:MAG: SUMF1/EgtB/PvdO family nonheme iron enzyme [Candidatus Manganitrophaceae bacterium]
MRRIFRKRFSVTEVVGLLAVTGMGMAIYAWAATTVPNTFTAGTTAKADEVNANFAALAAKADELEAKLQGLTNTVESCPPDSVRSGRSCIDKYEASVWETTDPAVIAKIKAGTVTLADLQGAGAIQRGSVSDDYGTGCPNTGNGCKNFYAVSIPGVIPSRFLTWFQAAAAARNAWKRLPTNAEWQAAAFGAPDGAPCVVAAGGPGNTGTVGCVSDVGTFDMVGNLWEWVADWMQDNSDSDGGDVSTAAFGSDGIFGIDEAFPQGDRFPAVLRRGGDWGLGTNAGVFALDASLGPSYSLLNIGFRCAR